LRQTARAFSTLGLTLFESLSLEGVERCLRADDILAICLFPAKCGRFVPGRVRLEGGTDGCFQQSPKSDINHINIMELRNRNNTELQPNLPLDGKQTH